MVLVKLEVYLSTQCGHHSMEFDWPGNVRNQWIEALNRFQWLSFASGITGNFDKSLKSA